MFNLYEIIRNAHGGHALDNLANPIRHHDGRGGRGGQGRRAGLSEGVLEAGVRTRMRSALSLALWGGHSIWRLSPDPAAAQATGDRAKKGGDILRPNPYLSQRSRGDRPAGFERDPASSPDTLAKMLPVIASMIFGEPCEIHGKSGVWRDPWATRQRRRTRRSWRRILGQILAQVSGMVSGRKPAAAASCAGSDRRAGGAPRLHSRPDIRRRAESDGSGATAFGRSGAGRRRARGAGRYFGVHPGKSY